MTTLSQRDVLVVSTLAGVGVAAGSPTHADAAAPEAGWFDRPMRRAQLTSIGRAGM